MSRLTSYVSIFSISAALIAATIPASANEDYRLLSENMNGFDVVAPVVPNTTSVPIQTGVIFYQLGVGYVGVNATGGYDILSVSGVNAVTSGGTQRIENARISGSTTPSITSQSGTWISNVSYNGTAGDYTVNIPSGTFSATPACNCAVETNLAYSCTIQANPTATAVSVRIRDTNPFSNQNGDFSIVCMGPR